MSSFDAKHCPLRGMDSYQLCVGFGEVGEPSITCLVCKRLDVVCVLKKSEDQFSCFALVNLALLIRSDSAFLLLGGVH